jgi:hypothetical protein
MATTDARVDMDAPVFRVIDLSSDCLECYEQIQSLPSEAFINEPLLLCNPMLHLSQ